MPRMTIVRYGDKDGKGSIVKVSGLFLSKTWTVLQDEPLGDYKRWTCIETGDSHFASIVAEEIDRFYRAQYELFNSALQG